MKYSLDRSYEILERTPQVLQALLSGIGEEWTKENEGPETFSPYDVVGHLIHGEKTDWAERVKIILKQGADRSFTPYDRFAMYRDSEGKSMETLLADFKTLRDANMKWFRGLALTESQLDETGLHPTFGEVTLRELLATWVVHDLTHIAQIARVMAKQYKSEIGPWTEFFRILNF